MTVFRITKKEYAHLSGKGAADYPGRWNQTGVPCLYTSGSSSLAQLELMVNVDDWRIFATRPFVILEIEIPESKIHIFNEIELPKSWDNYPINPNTQEFGSALFANDNFLGFSVPTAVNKLERNYILSPRSKHYADVSVIQIRPFKLDPRLLT